MLSESFYLRDDVLLIARELLGKVIVVENDAARCSGIISETEAYAGETDKASHAYGGRRTTRTETMYKKGGIAYVYLCYGIHHLFNVVSNVEGIPHAILIRAIKPLEGLTKMTERAANKKMKADGIGPGKLSAMLGINKKDNAISLQSKNFFIEDRGIEIMDKNILTSPRVGIDYAGKDALLPWRFIVKHKNIYL